MDANLIKIGTENLSAVIVTVRKCLQQMDDQFHETLEAVKRNTKSQKDLASMALAYQSFLDQAAQMIEDALDGIPEIPNLEGPIWDAIETTLEPVVQLVVKTMNFIGLRIEELHKIPAVAALERLTLPA